MIVVEIPGEPVPKDRPRFRAVTARDGRSFVNVYTDAKTRAFEKALALTAKVAMRGKQPLQGPLMAAVTAFMGVPVSWSAKKRDSALAGVIRPTGRPDWDNVAKSGLDALNGIVFLDDSQIVKAAVEKLYSETPMLRIEVHPLETMLGEN